MKKPLVILGSGPTLFDDMKSLNLDLDKCSLMAVKRTAYMIDHRFDYWDYWAGVHHQWMQDRADRVSKKTRMYHPRNCPINNPGGTSGLFAARVGMWLGYEHIILAGIPLTNEPNIFKPDREVVYNDRPTRSVWKKFHPEMVGRVFSQSGWTREILGAFPAEKLKDVYPPQKEKIVSVWDD